MKRIAIALATTWLLAAFGTPAVGADLFSPAPVYKAPPVYQPLSMPFSWSGFYAGLHAGYGWGRSSLESPVAASGGFSVDGALVGSTFGYNVQISPWVFGIEGDFAFNWMKGATSTGAAPCANCEVKNLWLATVRGRAGQTFGKSLAYLTGGFAFGGVETRTPAGAFDTKNKAGWTAGAGFEQAFAGPWSAKIEYLYVDLGKAGCGASICGINIDASFTSHILRAGLNARF